jgi:hypothetical protein
MAQQAAILAALDRLIELEESAEPAPWQVLIGNDPSNDLIVALRNDAARSLRGRRSILVRRRPVLCSECPESRQHWVDAASPMETWPTADWRHAAAGLEVPDGQGH